MTEPHPTKLYTHIVSLMQKGVSQKNIAKLVGKPEKAVYRFVQRARQNGDLPYATEHKTNRALLRRKLQEQNKQAGNFLDLVPSLPNEIVQWLIDETPPDGTVVELLRSLIADAYYDEQEHHT